MIGFEIRNWLVKPATFTMLLLWAAILLFALSNGATQSASRQHRIDSLTALQQERLATHPQRIDSFARAQQVAEVYWDDPRNAYDIGYVFGKKHFFKPNDRFVLATGQSSFHHSDHELTTSSEFWFSALRKAERLDNPTNTLYGTFDVAFVLVWLLPLVSIVFTYNALSLEREQGTLKMILAQGTSLRLLLISRMAFRLVVLVSFTLLVMLAGEYFFRGNFFFHGWGYVVLFTLLYALLWHWVAFFVNLLNRSSNFNAGVLFTGWMAGVLVLPALLNVIVTNVKPLPGKVILMDEVREMFTQNDQKNAEILDQFYTDHPEFVIKDSLKLMPLFMYKYMIKEMTTSEQLQPIMDDYKARLEGQSRAINTLAMLVPAMAYQEALEEISGNSLSQYLAFERFADQASREWRNYFHPISLANRYLTSEEFRNLPNPSFTTPDDARKKALLLMSLLGWNALAGMAVWGRMRRYQIA
jgi:ABC-2 type transport system permease protein